MILGARAAVICAVLSVMRTAGAEPCVPRAALDGDQEAVDRVTGELHKLGVEVGPIPNAPRCPVIAAVVEIDRGGGIAVAVHDGAQRSEGRVVSDASIAAAWIDSWLRDDFDAPSFAPVTVAAPATATALSGAAAGAPPSDALVVVVPQRSALDNVSIAAAFEQAWTDDGSRWTGITAGACMRVGFACIGGRARFATQDIATGLTAATRRDLAVLATASAAKTLGHIAIVPELGLGIGQITTDRIDGCKPPCDPTTMDCTDPPPGTCDNPNVIKVGDDLHAATFTLRASATLRIAVPLFEHVWLDGLAGVMLSPLGHTASYPFDKSSGELPPPVPLEQLELPGEPTVSFQLGVGIHVGAP